MEQTSLFAAETGKAEALTQKPSDIVAAVLRELKRPREREVLIKRYSLDGKGKRILEDIGKEYGITRERVRQIEKSAIHRLQDSKFDNTGIMPKITENLMNKGGLYPKEAFLDELLEGYPPSEKGSLEFLIMLESNIKELVDENLIHESYVLSEIPEELILKVSRGYVEYLEESKVTRSFSEMIDRGTEILNDAGKRGVIGRRGLAAIISMTKPIIMPEKERFGLSSWRDINPRSIKDKTYFILKKTGKPMHFAEIAEEITHMSSEKKAVTKQAVHNELIRDSRFVLIGRGIYALSEWGYEPGTVSDVIVDILRGKPPLHKNEIVNEVLKRRKVKEATIILNLQNKDKFKRVAKATYTLAGGVV